jgi:Flp pilus assembly secretin CpaC
VVEHRVYGRAPGVQAQVEVAIAAGVSEGYDFLLLNGPGTSAEELGSIQRGFEALVQKSQPTGSARPDLAYEMYRLGHIEADRAMGLLKALGYSTIEFEEKSTANKADSHEQIFNVVASREYKFPLVVKVMNASKTSLLAPDAMGKARTASSATASRGIEGTPELGGSHLYGTTSGEPQERLLLVYDRNEPEALERLVNLLQTYVDVASQQIVIEALVIEVNTSRLRQLGVELQGSRRNVGGVFETSDKGLDLPFTFLFSRNSFSDFLSFKGKLAALTESGKAEVLSSPSVLVLNDRQARIQVGQQIPVVRSTTTVSTTTSSVEYFPIGIVLNLRPRISPDQAEVTMQIETIISSLSESSQAAGAAGSQVAYAPVVDNRQVETFVRVADGTPFIIGGLYSTDQQGHKVGLPLLSAIPFLGRLLSRERVEQDRREVIVVITPHIVPLEEHSFSYLIPKDSDLFDRFDTHLFRNAYRVRDDDVWDLQFIVRSPVLLDLFRRVEARAQEDVMLQRQEPFQSLLAGNVPGEDALVRRMMYEIVDRLNFEQEVALERIFFFAPPADSSRGQGSRDVELQEVLAGVKPGRAAVLRYEAQGRPGQGHSFSLPLAAVSDTVLPAGGQDELLQALNQYDAQGVPRQWAIVLGGPEDVEWLRRVLVLKRVLELNENLPQTLQSFRPGVQILFPTRDDMRRRYHLVDREVARLFFETRFYYQAAERRFNQTLRQVDEAVGTSRP